MGKRLTNNLGLKVISVFLAFFVWLAVVNIANPETDGSREIPLEIVNGNVLTASGKTYEIIGDVDTVVVSYKIRVQDSGSVSSSDFKAYVDLAEMYEPTGAVPVKIDVNNSRVSSVTARPSVVRVDTEDLQRKQFELTAYLEGHAASGYREGNVTISPTQIYVSGPVSLVGQISTVGISINVEGADSDMSGTLPIRCYDSNGNEIELDDRITLSRTEAEYSLPILSTGYFLMPATAESTAARSCESTVASAAPPTPMPNGTMNTISRTTFRIDEKTRNIKGSLLSPRALRIFDTRL